MSYIRAQKVDQEEGAATEHGFALPEIDTEQDSTIDCNDDEQLQFVLALISQVADLSEGEALVVWKEIS
ncbi:hypothetical protein ABZY09_30440 [Streptomyces sp. NPDC002928]|uniref:hypothetical protein n=1 Tax=Streptomyces sp. NPDC002928 TaxID=3154440 RepID=UPI0033B5889A